MSIEKWEKIKICGVHGFSVILIYFTLRIVFYFILREFQVITSAFNDYFIIRSRYQSVFGVVGD